MEIFEPASYFCDSLDHESTKIGPNFQTQTTLEIKLSRNGFIISCSPNLIILTETKIKIIKLISDIEN